MLDVYKLPHRRLIDVFYHSELWQSVTLQMLFSTIVVDRRYTTHGQSYHPSLSTEDCLLDLTVSLDNVSLSVGSTGARHTPCVCREGWIHEPLTFFFTEDSRNTDLSSLCMSYFGCFCVTEMFACSRCSLVCHGPGLNVAY